MSGESSEGSTIKECASLREAWKFWLIVVHTNKGRQYQIEELVKVSTVANFFVYQKKIAGTLELEKWRNDQRRLSLGLFLDGVTPAWEDPRNAGGGCLSYILKDQTSPGVEYAWETVLMLVAGGDLQQDLDNYGIAEKGVGKGEYLRINGVVLTAKENRKGSGGGPRDFQIDFWMVGKWYDGRGYDLKDSTFFTDILTHEKNTKDSTRPIVWTIRAHEKFRPK
jgi:hypothetical protein